MMRAMESQGWVRVIVWSMVIAIVAPPPLLAQTLGGSGSTPSLGLSQGGSIPGTTTAPGQPIMTNPTSLQPLGSAGAACPAAAVASHSTESNVQSLNQFWPMEASSLLPSSVEQRMRQEGEGRQKTDIQLSGGGSPDTPAER